MPKDLWLRATNKQTAKLALLEFALGSGPNPYDNVPYEPSSEDHVEKKNKKSKLKTLVMPKPKIATKKTDTPKVRQKCNICGIHTFNLKGHIDSVHFPENGKKKFAKLIPRAKPLPWNKLGIDDMTTSVQRKSIQCRYCGKTVDSSDIQSHNRKHHPVGKRRIQHRKP